MGGLGARVQGVNFKRGGVPNPNVHIFYSIHVIVFKGFSNFTHKYIGFFRSNLVLVNVHHWISKK